MGFSIYFETHLYRGFFFAAMGFFWQAMMALLNDNSSILCLAAPPDSWINPNGTSHPVWGGGKVEMAKFGSLGQNRSKILADFVAQFVSIPLLGTGQFFLPLLVGESPSVFEKGLVH